jgi:ABC-type Fe3+ transport system substrate-binding protein
MKDERNQTSASNPGLSSFIIHNSYFIIPLALLLLGPILLHRQADRAGRRADETLVIISPHNEATRYEFARAFREAHFARTGRSVFVDWRTAGGTSEIARYVAAQYFGSFRDYWTRTLHRDWTPECASFDDPKAAGEGAMAARKAFLGSNTGCGVDLFFGGGSFDFMRMAAAGRLVDCGVVAAHPELFALSGTGSGTVGDKHIPNTLGGEPLWDPKGCWIGVCLGAFGICYNTDSLAWLGITQPPAQWADLASPRYVNALALADPTQSGSVAKAFEMLLQQRIAEAGGNVPVGWLRGMQLIERISANARHFTSEATEIPYSVQSGNAAAGMCIDFYGRFESEAVRRADGSSRLVYVTPKAGSSTGADPIGLFRGAPHAALAREFIEFAISPEGQKLWCFRAGTPGGPEKYTLRRLAIRPDLYAPQWRSYEADPDVDPYSAVAAGAALVYQPRWTGSLFAVISFVIRTAFIDPHDELKEAWQALIAAGFPPRATAEFSDMSAIDLTQSAGPIREALRSPDKLNAVVMARELDEHFREQYRQAGELARRGL